MNAGAMGGETFRQVVSVRYVDAEGNFHTKTPAEIEVKYREVVRTKIPDKKPSNDPWKTVRPSASAITIERHRPQ